MEAIGLKPRGHRICEMADGSDLVMDITTAEVAMGEIVGATTVFGGAETEPLLGVTVLESACMSIDPSSRSLYKRPSSRL